MAYISDSQQRQAYRWEGSWPLWNKKGLTQPKARGIIAWACRLYDIPIPIVRFQKWRTWYDPEDHSIVLSITNQNTAIALHEAAHAIHDYILGDYHEAHGPEWLGIYLVLLDTAGVASRSALELSARKYGLEWRSPMWVHWKYIRHKYPKLTQLAQDDR